MRPSTSAVSPLQVPEFLGDSRVAEDVGGGGRAQVGVGPGRQLPDDLLARGDLEGLHRRGPLVAGLVVGVDTQLLTMVLPLASRSAPWMVNSSKSTSFWPSSHVTVSPLAFTSRSQPCWLPLIRVLPFFRRTAAHAEGVSATPHLLPSPSYSPTLPRFMWATRKVPWSVGRTWRN